MANREIAKKRATFDYLTRLSWDHDYLAKKEIFLELRAGDKKMATVAQEYERLKKTGDDEDNSFRDALKNHSAVRTILNEYEAIAVGIFTNTLSEEIVARNHRQAIMDAVQSCEEFIEVTRKNATVKDPSKIYCECQKLVENWKNGTKSV